ncbi:hypothetical protein CDAR_210461 [Caerostris darwini]|uniref:Uncharacterized protein n=1 Tax=Caerostris darwini TaxID=1538125 RepID=A0AAV4MP99_9ARAC|nr:hypothetical protein CDAR_210461 [Caerostris darwini]
MIGDILTCLDEERFSSMFISSSSLRVLKKLLIYSSFGVNAFCFPATCILELEVNLFESGLRFGASGMGQDLHICNWMLCHVLSIHFSYSSILISPVFNIVNNLFLNIVLMVEDNFLSLNEETP